MAISIVAFLASWQPVSADTTKYGFYVADVEVTSSNCSNITSSKIEAWNKSYPYSVSYNPSTKTLRMENVKIERTGSYNRAIRNVSCDGLTIVFGKYCNLYAKDSSPVSLETNTTLKCEGGMWNCDSTRIEGLYEDAIAFRNSATLTIDGAYLELRGGQSSVFWFNKDNQNRIVIKNSIVTATGKNIFEGKFISLDTRTSQFYARATDKLYTSSTTPSIYYTKQIYATTNQVMMYDIESIPLSSTSIFPTDNVRDYVKRLYERDNDNYLTSYEVRRIKWFTYVNKGLTSVPFLKYFKCLKHLDLSENELGTLDLSANSQLEEVRLYDTKLTSLNLNGLTKLTTLHCGYNQLQSLDISQLTNLTSLNCYWNELTTVNTSNNTKLETFTASRQRTLTSIDVTKNTKLKSLDVGQCGLSSLDVTKNTELTTLDCSYNNITELNLNNNNKLQNIYIDDNRLTSLTFPQNATGLKDVKCYKNRLSSDVMQQVVSRLPRVSSGNFIPVYSNNEGNICLPKHVNTAESKGWTVKKYNGATSYEDYTGILEYKDRIAGVTITNELCEDLTQIAGVTKNTPNASARYLPASRTFQLSGVSINDAGGQGIFLDDGGTIELTGEPVFLNNYNSNGSSYTPMVFYIKGTGELILTNTMYVRNTIYLQEDCMVFVNISGTSDCIRGLSNGEIRISDNAQLRLFSRGNLISNLTNLSGGYAIMPTNMYFDRQRGNLQYTDVNNPVMGREVVLGNVHQLRTVRFQNYTWPVDFEHADYYASIYGNTFNMEEIIYSMYRKIIDFSEDYPSAGDNLGIEFKVSLKDEGYAFYPYIQGYCDNLTHDVRVSTSDTEQRFVFNYTVPTPDIPPVKNVNISIPIPHDGESPTWDTNLPTSTRDNAKEHFSKHYTIEDIDWWKGNVRMSEGETFEMGEEYTVKIRIRTEEGYQWHHNTTYAINSEPVPEDNILDISTTQKILIYNFGITDPDGINDIIADNKTDNAYYTLDGRRIIGKPTQKGIYINKGKKTTPDL